MSDTTPWHLGPMVCFDTETTGVDVEHDRIVTVCVAHVQAGQQPTVRHWLLDPGVEIPEEASAIHGITTEKARAEGELPAPVLDIVAEELVAAWTAGRPVIAMNCSFDLTILDRELARHELPTLAVRLGRRPMLMVDPLVIDRALDRYRPGKKRLEDLCRVYGVKLDDAHDAAADALAAARVAFRLAQRFPADVGVGLELLQEYQQAWHVEWAASFEEYMRAKVDPDCTIERDWPIRPAPDSSAAGEGEAPVVEDQVSRQGADEGVPSADNDGPSNEEVVADAAGSGKPTQAEEGRATHGVLPPSSDEPDAGRDAVETWSERSTKVRDGELSNIDHPLFDWKAACREAGIQPTAVLVHLINDWPINDQAARPNRLGDIDRKVATDPIFADMVRELIADLGKAVA